MWQRLDRWFRADRTPWRTHLVALIVTSLYCWLLLIASLGPQFPLGLALLLPVVFSAYVGGFWPGVLSTLIATGMANSVLIRIATSSGTPRAEVPLTNWTFMFVLMGLVVSSVLEALHRSRRFSDAQQRLHLSTLTNISDAIVTTDAQGRIQYLNRAAQTLLQRDMAAVLNQPFEAVVDIRDATIGTPMERPAALVHRAPGTVHTGGTQVLRTADGRMVPVEASAAPVRDEFGQLLRVVLTIHDCSEQRRIERVLHERLEIQSRFERIASVVPGAIHELLIRANGQHQLLYANPSFREIFGVEPASLRADAAALMRLVHPEDIDRVKAVSEYALRTLTPINIEHRIVTSHKGLGWVALVSVPTLAADGDVLWHGVFIDITERKRAEERLRASQLQLSAALESSGMGVMTIDLVTGHVDMDQMARQLWMLEQVPPEQLHASHMLTALPPEEREAARQIYAEMVAGGAQVHRSEYRLLAATGEERWLVCRGRIYRDEVTGHLLKVGVVVDTTLAHQAAQQRTHSQKLEALGVLAGGIAHDFNNLLLAISGNARLLLADLGHAEPMRASVLEIEKAAMRAADLVRRILSFSSVPDVGQHGQPHALRPMLDEILGLARAVLPASVTLDTTIPEQLPEVLADSSQMHQTLINVLTNAADAANTASAADVRVQLVVDLVEVTASTQAPAELQPGQYVRLTISDNGSGIDPAILPRIFDPFFTTKVAGRGTGLGLAIVHGIMKSVDGAVTVHNRPASGASFALFFPAKPDTTVTKPVTVMQPATRSARILYVDDEESLVFLMTRTLERMGHRVTGCVSPEQALEIFGRTPGEFDLVVSDMTMPGMSGLELAEQVLAQRASVPFIITSGYINADDVERARAVGVRQMIMKPNTVDELSVALTDILQQQAIAIA